MRVLQQIWLYEIIGCMLLMDQNTTMRLYGARIKTYFFLCPKTYRSFGKSVIIHRYFATSHWGARICETSLLWKSRLCVYEMTGYTCIAQVS